MRSERSAESEEITAATEPAFEASPARRERIGHYRLERPLGRGGMGEVYLATDTRLGRQVALKRVSPHKRDAQSTRSRFWREARALAALGRKPGLVEVYEFGEEDGELFLAMELIEGVTLSEAMDAPWPTWAVHDLLTQLLCALDAVHAESMTHRDIKPANIMLDRQGRLRLVDFGLARRMDRVEEQVTSTGTVVGTPAYMAPEQYRGEEGVGPAADIFSVGVLTYRLLAGRHPFSRESVQATAIATAAGAYTPIAEAIPDLDEGWRALVTRCLAANPEDRFEDAGALRATLDALTPTRDPAPATPERPALQAWLDARTSTSSAVAQGASSSAAPAGRWRRVALLATVTVAAVAAAVGVALTSTPSTELPPPATAHSAIPGRAMARPVLWIGGFGSSDPDASRIFEDALRLHLEHDPEIALAVPTAAMAPHLVERLEREPDKKWLFEHGPDGASPDLRVRGHLEEPDAEALCATLEVFDTKDDTPWLDHRACSPINAGATGLAATVAQVLLASLGHPTASTPWTGYDDAYAAYLDARDLYAQGDLDAGHKKLDRALRFDPDFSLAAAERVMRGRAGDKQSFVDAAAQLAKSPDARPIPARARARLDAWTTFHSGDDDGDAQSEGVAALRAVVARWPYAIDTYDDLLRLYFHDGAFVDLREVERLAVATLKAAPHHKAAASRLNRAMSWRGRQVELEATWRTLETPIEDDGHSTIRAERDLYLQRYEAAIDGFTTSIRRNQDESYAYHMRVAARILDGQCAQAVAEARARVSQLSTGPPGSRAWAYALELQALLCWGRWDGALLMLERWRRDGGARAAFNNHATAVVSMKRAQGVEDAVIEAELRAELDDPEDDVEGTPYWRAVIIRNLCRVSTTPADLRAWADTLEDALIHHETLPRQHAIQRQKLAKRCRNRAALVEGGDVEAALDAYRAEIVEVDDVKSEGDLSARVDSLVNMAEAYTYAGHTVEARQIWASITQMGYTRLWRTAHYALAVKRSAGHKHEDLTTP